MAWLAAALYMLVHAMALWLPGHATLASFLFLIGAPLLAAAACTYRLVRSWHSDVRIGWLSLTFGMLLWAGGMALNMYQEVALGNVDAVPGIAMLLYVLYGVPLTFAMAHPRHEPWYLIAIDGALALLLGYLFFVHTFSYATPTDAPDPAIGSLRLMFDIENIFIAVFALLRYITSEDGTRRGLFRALTVFAWVYLAMAAYINHMATDTGYGALPDLLIDIPFLLLAVMAFRHGDEPARQTPRRLTLAVRAGAPLILPSALLVVSALLVDQHPHLAVFGFIFATLGAGLRGVVMQVRAMEGQDQLDRLSRVDALTGVANRREFDQVLLAEWGRARRSGQPMGLLMIDIDHFKQFNDRFGHPMGDACLRAVANTLNHCATRGTDVVARYGGEEFAVVVPATPREGVLALADTLRGAVERIRLASPDGVGQVGVTISVGAVVIAKVAGADPTALLKAADAALYAAKHEGRNRVVEGQVP